MISDEPTKSVEAPNPAAHAALAAYDPIARAAHWLTVLLVAAEFVVGWTMPDIEWGTEPTGLIGIHLVLGGSLLVVVVFRVLWRLTHRAPPPPRSLPAWQHRAAQLTHFTLYALLLIMPLCGWASASAREWPVRAFGLLRLPAIVAPHAKIGFKLGDVHADILSWVLLCVIGLHVLAALYHRFVKRDVVLKRMLPSAGP